MALAKTKRKKLERKLFTGTKFRPWKNPEAQKFSAEQINSFTKLLNYDAKICQKYQSEKCLVIGFDEVGRGSVAGPVCTGAYSAGTFYKNPDKLIQEIKYSCDLLGSQMLNFNTRDSYYAETLVDEFKVEDLYTELGDLTALLTLEDSKQVPHNKRSKLCEALLNVPCFADDEHLFYAVNFEAAEQIDKDGIVSCIWLSMAKTCVDILLQYIEFYNSKPQELVLLVDGPKTISNLESLIHEELSKRYVHDLSFRETDKNEKQYSLDLFDQAILLRQIPIVKGDGTSSLIAAASNLAKLKRDQYMESLSENYAVYDFKNNVGYGTKKHMLAIAEHGFSDEHRKSFLTEL